MTFNFDKVPQPNNWTIAIFCFILLLMVFEITQYRKKIIILGKSLFSQRYFSLLLRESKVVGEFFAFLLLIVSILTYAFGVLVIVERFYPTIVSRISYVGCWGLASGALLLLYAVKNVCYKIYGALYDRERVVFAIQLYKFAFLADSSVVLLPVLAMAAFTCNFVWMYAFIPIFIGLAFVWLYKLLKINPRKINLFHFFVYFCTLEILPYIVLVKLITVI